MPHVKLNLSMEAEVVDVLRRRAAHQHQPLGRYLARLVVEDEQRWQDELAVEGYRLLDGDTGKLAEDAWRAAQDTWPGWAPDPRPDSRRSQGGKGEGGRERAPETPAR